MEPHCFKHAVPWSLYICSTQHSPERHDYGKNPENSVFVNERKKRNSIWIRQGIAQWWRTYGTRAISGIRKPLCGHAHSRSSTEFVTREGHGDWLLLRSGQGQPPEKTLLMRGGLVILPTLNQEHQLRLRSMQLQRLSPLGGLTSPLVQVTSLRWKKQGINRKLFNRKSISRNTTHRQSYHLQANANQARNQLRITGEAKSFPRGAQIFWTTRPIFLNYAQHIFPGRAKIFLGWVSPPWLRAWC